MTDKQKLFCKEYMVDLNASAAYQRAGYISTGNAAEASASQLLRNPKVAKEIQHLMDKRANKVAITAENVLNDILDTRDRLKDTMAYMDDNGNERIDTQCANARLKANELLGKHLKLFTDKVEVEVTKMPEIKLGK